MENLKLNRKKFHKNNEVCIIGIGRFSKALIAELYNDYNSKISIIAIDKDENIVKEISDFVDIALVGDSTSVKFLMENNIHTIDNIVLGMGSFIETSLLTASSLIEAGAKNISAKAVSETHARILKQIGVHRIITPEVIAARSFSIQLRYSVLDIENGSADDTIEIYNKELSTCRVKVNNSNYFHKKVSELNLKSDKVSLIFVNRKKKIILPHGEFEIQKDDIITFIGEHLIIREVYKNFSKMEEINN